MAFEDDMIAIGHSKIDKQKYFVELDDEGKPTGEVEVCPSTDCNGNPINPHVWVPAGKKFRCYTDTARTRMDQKIKDGAAPDVVVNLSKGKIK